MAWVTVPPCGICLQHQRHSLQDQQLLFGSEGFSLSLPDSVPTMGFFPQMSKLLLGIPGAGASFLSGRDRALPTAMTVVTRPKPWHKHSFNNYIGYKLLLVHILIHIVNKHKVVGTHFFGGLEGFICEKSEFLVLIGLPFHVHCIFFISSNKSGFFAENVEAVELF